VVTRQFRGLVKRFILGVIGYPQFTPQILEATHTAYSSQDYTSSDPGIGSLLSGC
jgi:hypothetical protein